MTTPPFLRSVTSLGDRLFSATFTHSYKRAKGQTHVLYVPPLEELRSLLVFIPGNPGLVSLYTPLLTHLTTASPHLAVIAHSYLGHTSALPAPPPEALDLDAQVDANVEFVDEVRGWAGDDVSVTLAGHSVGAWVACEIAKQRPDSVDCLFLLTPTLSNLASTPNGRRLWWLFTPFAGWLLPTLSPLITPIVPLIVEHAILADVKSNDADFRQLLARTLHDFITSPKVLTAVLTLARCEMGEIVTLDEECLSGNREKICILWAGKDDWVGVERERIERVLGVENGTEGGNVIELTAGVPHSWCMEHNILVADLCTKWLNDKSLTERRQLSRIRQGPQVVQAGEAHEGHRENIIM